MIIRTVQIRADLRCGEWIAAALRDTGLRFGANLDFILHPIDEDLSLGTPVPGYYQALPSEN